jgi:hypothetical protein
MMGPPASGVKRGAPGRGGREFFADSGGGPDSFRREVTGPADNGSPPDADPLGNESDIKMGLFIHNAPDAPDRRDRSGADAAGYGESKGPARGPRFARATIGFWLGGGILGTAGGILGVSMPYHHPVAVVISTLWWGLYLGCFGASVGALFALLTERAPSAPPRGSGGAGAPPGGADGRGFPAGPRGLLTPDQAGSRTFADGGRA